MKDGPGSEDKAYDYMNAWYTDETTKTLLDVVGYGSADLKTMQQFSDETLATAGLNPITVPVLAQLPLDLAMRSRMQEEFEKIKAGF